MIEAELCGLHQKITTFDSNAKFVAGANKLNGSSQDLRIRGEYYKAGLESSSLDNWGKEDCICLKYK